MVVGRCVAVEEGAGLGVIVLVEVTDACVVGVAVGGTLVAVRVAAGGIVLVGVAVACGVVVAVGGALVAV